MGAKLKTGAVAAFGVAAFAAGWARGHVSGVGRALRVVRTLRRHAECRAHEDGCRWVYPTGHPREGEPFGEHPDGGLLHPIEREARRHRPFAGLPLLETIEFDAAEVPARRPLPPDLPPWWERPTGGGPGASEYRERKRREDERVRRQRDFLRLLRRRLFGGLRLGARGRLGPSAGEDRSLRVEVENTALVALEVRELRLTYAYRRPLAEWLFGRGTPRTPLAGLAGGGELPRYVGPGETLRWSTQMRSVEDRLEDAGMSRWPDTRLMRLNDPLSGRLARRGGMGLRAVNLLRRLTSWRLAVELVEGGGGSRKAEVRFVPPWEE